MDESGAAANLGGGDTGEQNDPFAGVESDPLGDANEVAEAGVPQEGTLGGDGATLEDLGGAEEAEADPGPEAEQAEVGAEEPEPESPVAEQEDEVPEPKTARPDPDPDPSPGKVGTSEREYIVQRQAPDDDDGNPVWVEVLRITASNGEAALRSAYAELVPSESEAAVTLVVIPVHFFKPKTVRGKAKVNRAIEID